MFEIRPDCSLQNLQPEQFSENSAMKSYKLSSDCILLEPRLKKIPKTQRKAGEVYTILGFTIWVGHEVTDEQLLKIVEIAGHHNVPIDGFTVQSIPKHLRRISELVDIYNTAHEFIKENTQT